MRVSVESREAPPSEGSTRRFHAPLTQPSSWNAAKASRSASRRRSPSSRQNLPAMPKTTSRSGTSSSFVKPKRTTLSGNVPELRANAREPYPRRKNRAFVSGEPPKSCARSALQARSGEASIRVSWRESRSPSGKIRSRALAVRRRPKPAAGRCGAGRCAAPLRAPSCTPGPSSCAASA